METVCDIDERPSIRVGTVKNPPEGVRQNLYTKYKRGSGCVGSTLLERLKFGNQNQRLKEVSQKELTPESVRVVATSCEASTESL